MRTLESEVGAGEASLVRGVNDDAQVADKGRSTLLGGEEEVTIPNELFMSAQCSLPMHSGKSDFTLRRSWVRSCFHACPTSRQPRT
jgi:hypothetical protein